MSNSDDVSVRREGELTFTGPMSVSQLKARAREKMIGQVGASGDNPAEQYIVVAQLGAQLDGSSQLYWGPTDKATADRCAPLVGKMYTVESVSVQPLRDISWWSDPDGK